MFDHVIVKILNSENAGGAMTRTSFVVCCHRIREQPCGWSQDFQRGDEHWPEDCVKLYWVKDRGEWTTGTDCIFVGVSGDDLRMKWIGMRQLAISYPSGTVVTKAVPKLFTDVTITYAEDPKSS